MDIERENLSIADIRKSADTNPKDDDFLSFYNALKNENKPPTSYVIYDIKKDAPTAPGKLQTVSQSTSGFFHHSANSKNPKKLLQSSSIESTQHKETTVVAHTESSRANAK